MMTEANRTLWLRMKRAAGILIILFTVYFLTVPPGRVGEGLQQFYQQQEALFPWPASVTPVNEEYQRNWFYSTISRTYLYYPDPESDLELELEAVITLYHGPMLYGQYGGLGRGKYVINFETRAPSSPGLQAYMDGLGDWLTITGKVHFTGYTEIDIDRVAVNFNGDGIKLEIEPLTARLILTHEGYILSGTINGSGVIAGMNGDSYLISNQAGDFRLEL